MKISLWLLPCFDQALGLFQQIESFSWERKKAPFPPHLTLYSPIQADPDELLESQRRHCQSQTPLELQRRGISHSEAHYRAIVIDLLPSPALLAWQQTLQQTYFPTDSRTYAPHLSLVYDLMNLSEREALVPQARAEETYRFDRLLAMRTESSDPAGHRYQEWEQLWELPLEGK
ncbi:MAG: 2'-5' RNA ligase family protein [Bacteroidota bacterium]